MPSFLSTIPTTPPAPDRLEVSLFGPGFGECVVVHIGDGSWFVIDSCVHRETGSPIAIDYLRHLGVPIQDKIAAVVATHWHDDHTSGLSTILKESTSAKFICSAALNKAEFKTLVAQSLLPGQGQVGSGEFRKVIDVINSRAAGRGASKSPEWAMENKLLHRDEKSEIYALSPSSGTLALGLRELGALIPGSGLPQRRAVSNKANKIALVVGIRMGSAAAILGSDLESGPDARTGWKAILALNPYPLPKASVFKVPHHGSKTAHEPGVWTQILESDPVSVLTPFTAGSTSLPTKTDRQRLVGSSSAVYLSSNAATKSSAQYRPAVSKLIKAMARSLVDLEAGMGLVRVRWNSSGPTVECFGKASQIT